LFFAHIQNVNLLKKWVQIGQYSPLSSFIFVIFARHFIIDVAFYIKLLFLKKLNKFWITMHSVDIVIFKS